MTVDWLTVRSWISHIKICREAFVPFKVPGTVLVGTGTVIRVVGIVRGRYASHGIFQTSRRQRRDAETAASTAVQRPRSNMGILDLETLEFCDSKDSVKMGSAGHFVDWSGGFGQAVCALFSCFRALPPTRVFLVARLHTTCLFRRTTGLTTSLRWARWRSWQVNLRCRYLRTLPPGVHPFCRGRLFCLQLRCRLCRFHSSSQ